MSILNRLFCDFLVPDSLFVMLFLLGSFGLGLLLGWMLWGEKIKKAIADLAASNTLTSSLQAELSGLKDKLTLRDADLAKSGKDMEDLRVAFRSMQAEKGQTDAYYMTATNDLATATSDLSIAKEETENLRLQLATSIAIAEENAAALATANIAAEASAAALASAQLAAEAAITARETATISETRSVEADDAPITEVYEEESELRLFEPISEVIEAPVVEEEVIPEAIIEEVAVAEIAPELVAIVATEEAVTEEVVAEEAPTDELLMVDITPESETLSEEIIAEAASDEPVLEVIIEDEPAEEVISEVRSVEAVNEFEALEAALDEPIMEGELVAEAPIVEEISVEELVLDTPVLEPIVAEPIALTSVIEKPALVPPAGMRLNDLKVVEGIGPKVSGLLHENGIYTWAELAATTPESLKEILTKGGDRFRLLNPGSWPAQAAMLAAGNWNGFKEYTQFLVAGVDPKGTVFTPKEDPRRRLFVSPKGWHSDDLKIIEGIGPKIEQLVKDGGVHYWAELADTTPSRLREILASGGERFQMHDPTTWPDQARLLANEEWDKFDEFVKFLNRGRTPHS